MAATPPLSPATATARTLHVEDWIRNISPPSSPDSPLKRKFATALGAMSARNPSPKRARRDSEVLPSQSVSTAGAPSTASVLTLNERIAFSPPNSQASTRSPRRANSPSRDNIAVLASASPPTITEPSSGLKVPPPQRVLDVIARLEDGLDRGWIPGRLRNTIEADGDFGYQRIERHAWDESTARDIADSNPEVLREVKQIWLNARVCQSRGRDENAWCMDVMQPLVRLAIKLDGKEKLWLQSIQSQAIATEFLSRTSDAGNARLLDRKADFTLSFSHMPSPGFEDLYDRLRAANSPVVSHMADAFTKTTAVFSCIEVKPASGDHTEAEYQISVFMGASLRKKQQLAQRVGMVDMSNVVEPCIAVVGHQMHVYLAYVGSQEKDLVRILGPEVGPLGLCETSSVSGIFRALRLWRNIIRYGRDEGSDGFWGGFMEGLLHSLADVDQVCGLP